MKRIITLISMFLLAGGILMAQTTTPKLSYEVVIRDGDNNLLVDQAVTVDVSVLSATDAVMYTENDLDLVSDANGILIVAFGENVDWQALGVDWSNAKIRLDIDHTGDNVADIVQIVPVYAVPYALQSPVGDLLTTDEIVRYFSSISFNDDMRRILKAFHENTYGLEEDWVDTFKHYLMYHMEEIRQIIVSYSDKVTPADIWNTNNTIIANTEAYERGVEILKEYAEEHMEDALEMALYYIEHYTSEYDEAVGEWIEVVKANDDLYPYLKTFFESTFEEYLHTNGYIQTTDCPDFEICD